MWITNTITARMLICLAGFSIPLQGLPVASCACCPQDSQSKGTDCCGTLDPTDQVLSVQAATNACCCTGASICHCNDGCSVRKKQETCNTTQKAEESCCISSEMFNDPACQCGPNCHCGERKEPVTPIAPSPVESNSLEKLVDNSISTESLSADYQSQDLRRAHDAPSALAALDLCVSLCRFTL
ncbi:hypothetical protein [uncultured Gimesia sp.]|uniref:hypothetical protein n=1 Tax=uncultured Gimesia sp. TaxID=1678688 RepID=UPI0030DDC8A3